jgi:hydroxyacylglutathione hydrolase
MSFEITPISLPLPLKLGQVNCYLIRTDAGFFLIDTGGINNRLQLDQALEKFGVRPGLLKWILLTHGDFDHTGSAAYLRGRFGAKIAMHRGDSAMLQRGDLYANRKRPNLIIRAITSLIFKFGQAEKCAPDLLLEDNFDFTPEGLQARVLLIPGHSSGSIGVFTAAGDLFCGDLLVNTAHPMLNSIIDDLAVARTTLERLETLPIQTVYPGHGSPFLMKDFLSTLKTENS